MVNEFAFPSELMILLNFENLPVLGWRPGYWRRDFSVGHYKVPLSVSILLGFTYNFKCCCLNNSESHGFKTIPSVSLFSMYIPNT